MARPCAERDRRVDEREVRERLREVAELPARSRVVLLGEQADVVAEVEQPLEELARLVVLALQRQHLASQNEQGRKTPSPPGSPSTAPSSRGR